MAPALLRFGSTGGLEHNHRSHSVQEHNTALPRTNALILEDPELRWSDSRTARTCGQFKLGPSWMQQQVHSFQGLFFCAPFKKDETSRCRSDLPTQRAQRKTLTSLLFALFAALRFSWVSKENLHLRPSRPRLPSEARPAPRGLDGYMHVYVHGK